MPCHAKRHLRLYSFCIDDVVIANYTKMSHAAVPNAQELLKCDIFDAIALCFSEFDFGSQYY